MPIRLNQPPRSHALRYVSRRHHRPVWICGSPAASSGQVGSQLRLDSLHSPSMSVL